MAPGLVSGTVVTERAAWIRRMLAEIRALPLDDAREFAADPRTVAASP
jgi:hypothetical protein